jgi:hypothetical protein
MFFDLFIPYTCTVLRGECQANKCSQFGSTKTFRLTSNDPRFREIGFGMADTWSSNDRTNSCYLIAISRGDRTLSSVFPGQASARPNVCRSFPAAPRSRRDRTNLIETTRHAGTSFLPGGVELTTAAHEQHPTLLRIAHLYGIRRSTSRGKDQQQREHHPTATHGRLPRMRPRLGTARRRRIT